MCFKQFCCPLQNLVVENVSPTHVSELRFFVLPISITYCLIAGNCVFVVVVEVAPAELEAMLMTHKSVQDAGVVGRKDERVGELPTAFVVVKQNHRVTEQQLTDYVAGNGCYGKRY